MTVTSAEFQKITSKFKDLHILVVGDLMLDRYVWGTADRVSEESPVLVVDVQKKDYRLGGAGNVVSNLVNLGTKVSLASVVGKDFYGEQLSERLTDLNVNQDAVLLDESRPTTTKKRVIARGQQLVRIDYEDKSPISNDLEEQLIEKIKSEAGNYDAVIVSDYAKGVMTPGLLGFFAGKIKEDTFGLKKCPVVLDPKPSNQEYYRGFNVMKPNRSEAQALTGIRIIDRESALAAAKMISSRYKVDLVLLSLGADGLLLYTGEHPEGILSATQAQKVYDVSGAGDALVSTFTACIAAGVDYAAAGDFANLAASYVVSEVGTVPVNLACLKDICLSTTRDSSKSFPDLEITAEVKGSDSPVQQIEEKQL